MIILIPLCLWIIYVSYSLFKRYFEYNKIKNIFLNVISSKNDLQIFSSGILGKPSIMGNIEGNSIYIELMPGLAHSIAIHITHPDDFPYHLQISDRLMLDYERSSLIQTSNEDFNRRIFISSLYTTGATALMDKSTRTIINSLYSLSNLFTLQGNRITVRFYYSIKNIIDIEYKTKKALRSTLDLIKRLTRKGNIKDLLSENALSDPDRIVRKRNLELLISHFNFEDLKETLEKVLKKALKDRDREIQYIAADHLGKEGLPYLYNLFNNVSSWDKPFRIKIITSIARIQGTASMSFLIEYYNTLDIKEYKIKIINLFEDYGDKQANNLLIEQLKEDIDHDLKLAIIKALGRCGTLDAVEPLYQISKQIIILPSLKTAAKQSIARIQSHFGAGEKGWLSLTDADQSEGSLSLMENDDKE